MFLSCTKSHTSTTFLKLNFSKQYFNSDEESTFQSCRVFLPIRELLTTLQRICGYTETLTLLEHCIVPMYE